MLVTKKLTDSLTYANVMATTAVFLALGGGAYAAVQLPRDSVGTRQIRNGSITPAKLSARTRASLRGPAGPPGDAGRDGSRGEAGEPGREGPVGPSDAYTSVGSPATLLAGESELVADLEPPPGEYEVTGLVNVTSHGGQLNCQIEVEGSSKVFPAFVNAPSNEIAVLVVSGALFTNSAEHTIELVCEAEEGPMTIKGMPRLTAVMAGTIHGPVP